MFATDVESQKFEVLAFSFAHYDLVTARVLALQLHVGNLLNEVLAENLLNEVLAVENLLNEVLA